MTNTALNWQQSAEAALGVRFTALRSLGGGDFAEAFKAKLDNDQSVFIKTHQSPPDNFFSTEANGLSWLRETKTVNIPEVLSVSDQPPYLAMQWIDVGAGRVTDDEDLGRALARLHQQPFACFGRPDHRTTGSLAVPNEPHQDWATFYASQRLIPLARIAEARRALPEKGIRKLMQIAEKLDQWQLNEPASLLHGDLWAGNRVVDKAGDSWLIDPAAHGGCREFDLAMMMLFGGYDQTCFAAYHETYPLEPDWQSRVSLHQLAPLTVHAIKFGVSYQSATLEALAKYVN